MQKHSVLRAEIVANTTLKSNWDRDNFHYKTRDPFEKTLLDNRLHRIQYF